MLSTSGTGAAAKELLGAGAKATWASSPSAEALKADMAGLTAPGASAMAGPAAWLCDAAGMGLSAPLLFGDVLWSDGLDVGPPAGGNCLGEDKSVKLRPSGDNAGAVATAEPWLVALWDSMSALAGTALGAGDDDDALYDSMPAMEALMLGASTGVNASGGVLPLSSCVADVGAGAKAGP